MIETSIHKDFRDAVRRFVREKVAPLAATIDREQRPPIESFEASVALGLPGLPYPESLGGSEGDMLSQCIMLEEVARRPAWGAGWPTVSTTGWPVT